MHLSEYDRDSIVRHVTEIFFPTEVDQAVMTSISSLLKEYICSVYDDSNPFGSKVNQDESGWLYIVPGDGIVDAFDISLPRFCADFAVPFIKRCPELKTYCGGSAKYVLLLDVCPVPGLKDAVDALCSFRYERKKLSSMFASELRKSATTESFLKKFPGFKTVMAPWVEETVLDLPVTADLDMSAISAVGFGEAS